MEYHQNPVKQEKHTFSKENIDFFHKIPKIGSWLEVYLHLTKEKFSNFILQLSNILK